MNKNKLFLIPILFGMFLASCGGGGSGGGGGKESTKYTVTFIDEIGNTLESKKWEEGTIPSYNYVKEDTAEWDYTVDGWSLTQGGAVITIPAVSADATYYAIVSQVKRSYLITFYNENNQQIKSDTLEYGAQPTCDYTGPSDTSEWDYTFLGWATTSGGTALASIPTVTGVANYYARISSAKQTYEIKWCENDGYVIDTSILPYGTVPSHDYQTTSSQEYTYTFLGWAAVPNGTPLTSLPAVSENAIYYAQISKTKNKYTITFNSNGGSAVNSITEDYGTSISKPADPKKDGYYFVAWSTDTAGKNTVTWPYTLTGNVTFFANWNEKVDIKGYLKTLMGAISNHPYSYIPDAMREDYSHNLVEQSEVTYDFNNFTNVSSIKYGGFGEQWHMVIENIGQSELFYNVLTVGETAISASVVLFNNYLDKNPGTTASHSLNETTYTAKLEFSKGILTYSIRYKTNLTIPFFGEVTPQIDMVYDVTSLKKTVRIQLTENNAMKYVVTDSSCVFALEYGVETVSRKAYFELAKDEDDAISGHIYEFVQYKDKDLLPACADFYIDEDYVSVVGNKASGLIGFTGYINELYKTSTGKLLGYKVRETFTKWGFEKTYNTLWFNLNDILNINSVKAIANSSVDPHENNHDVYLNGSSKIFTPTKNKVAILSTSRRYDVEMRKQYFYGIENDKIVEYETNIPMMFIQDNGTESGETNYSTFEADILKDNGIAAKVMLSNTYLTKIREDYLTLIDVFIENKDKVNSSTIEDYIGSASPIN